MIELSRCAAYWLAGLGMLSLASGCNDRAHASAEPLSAGAATVFDTTRDAFSLPVPGLDAAQRAQFFVGNSFFNQNWVSAPASASERDGLGPLFNARSCSGCHFKDGRGRPPEVGEEFTSLLLRLSVPGRDEHGAALPHPAYGDQLQGMGLPGVPAEGVARVHYSSRAGRFDDGESYELLVPSYSIEQLAYGRVELALGSGHVQPAGTLQLSPRVAPAMIGVGLLEAVPESTLQALSDPLDRDHDGISGRLNRVWDVQRAGTAIGRFGWKAEQPSLRQQIAAAFSGDMGLSTSLFPAPSHTVAQGAAQALPSGGDPEVSDRTLESVTEYARTLAVPARRSADPAQIARGERLFEQAGCASCHVQTLETAELPGVPSLSAQVIHPYTDLLLHDLGEALSDRRPSFEALGQEWRTPPLWGLGLVNKVNGHTRYLHDGRARSLNEAVLWHGGEAEAAQRAFKRMSGSERAALLAFIESL
jgi:CxxC motif-containing protein (DUF1111 family)